MAFMGILMSMMFVGVALAVIIAIIVGLIVITLIFLILAIVFTACHKKTPGIVFFCLAGTGLYMMASMAIYPFLPQKVDVKTPSGVVEVWDSDYKKLRDYVIDGNIEKVDKMLNKHPELIYYNRSTCGGILHRAEVCGSIPMVQCILDHGAKFDDAIVYENVTFDYSLQSYFDDMRTLCDEGDDTGSDEILNMVEFMLENGAEVNFYDKDNKPNALFTAVDLVGSDGVISDGDIELIKLLKSHGASCTKVSYRDFTAYDYYVDYCRSEKHSVIMDDNYAKLAEVLEN